MSSLNYDKIIGLIYSEKSNIQIDKNKYCFKINSSCNKEELKTLINKTFSVEVKKINVSNVSGKVKRFKGFIGKKSSYKKAVVTIKKGQSINFESL